MQWWMDFVFNKLASIRPQTRGLVRVLDARAFARDAYYFSDESERTLQRSFRRAFWLLPNADSILLDDHPDLDPGLLISVTRGETAQALRHPVLLSIAACPFQLPGTFFNLPALQSLVYLDLSGVPGSILPLLQPTLVPELRILKLRNREIDDTTFSTLVKLFRLRLWSLDVGHNKITDGVLDVFKDRCFPVTQLRSDAHFLVEGKVVTGEHGTPEYGPFSSIEESQWSGAFNHPERHFVDPPMYMARSDQGPQEYDAFRSSGRGLLRKDSANAASSALSEGVTVADDIRSSTGITHIHFSDNMISAVGIEKLIRVSNGQLEEISCDTMPFLPLNAGYNKIWPRGASLRGIIGAAHLFRPVLSSNLRVLRIHHSFVTNMPSLQLDGLSTSSRLHIVENTIFPRVEEAYPQTFTPDMNPRLLSLTLTHIPRRSSGPLASKLISFLKLLSAQERAIQDVKRELSTSSWRAPGMLQGLRHLRLEFEPDPLQDGFSALDDLDAEELLSSGDRGFSFFEDERVERVVPQVEAKKTTSSGREGQDSSFSGDQSSQSGRDDDNEFTTFAGQWNGNTFQTPVWIGKSPASNTFLADYRRLALSSLEGVGPATPAQVKAGAPAGSYVSHTAWRLAIVPDHITPPATSDLSGMRDVLDDLREYRLSGRARYEGLQASSAAGESVSLGEPHYFWTGTLEVLREDPAARTRPSQYWR